MVPPPPWPQKATEQASTPPTEAGPYLVASVVALGAAAVVTLTGDDAFERFFGPVPAEAVIAASTGAGVLSLRVLARHGWPQHHRPTTPARGLSSSTAAAIGFAAIVIPMDIWLRFPEGINTPWPQSIPFYIAVAFVAVTVFYLVPLALVLSVADRTNHKARSGWPVVVAVGSLEAVFQVLASVADTGAGLTVFVGVHLVAIGVFQLMTFRRSGFASMLTFRLSYYALWHVAWGWARLRLLF